MSERAKAYLTADIIIEMGDGRIVLIRRRNPPHDWALPGGFVDPGESLEGCAVREAREETGLEIELRHQLHTYSEPDRDPRGRSVTTVFVASANGTLRAGDDAAEVARFDAAEPPTPLAFDHAQILADYLRWRNGS